MIAKCKNALIVGVSGIVGRSLVQRLNSTGGWNITGLARQKYGDIDGISAIACDLTDAAQTKAAIAEAGPITHLFFCTWSRQASETDNCRVNGAMLQNALEGAATGGVLRHAALVTGLKHYLGSFENYGKQAHDTPFSEEQERLPGDNFYYTQEDILFATAAKHGFSWSVARPHTIIGYAPGNAMNLGTAIAVYATLCKASGKAFVFPGSPQAWNGLVDMTDAELLAQHLEWESSTPEAANRAFNVVNGDYFRWRKMWRQIADYFGIVAAPYPGNPTLLADYLADAEHAWQDLVVRHGLRATTLKDIAPWWHVDADLGRTQECITDMSRSREAGFLVYRRTSSAFRDLFDKLRAEKIIPW